MNFPGLIDTVVCGDCTKIVPEFPRESIDGIVIDPPYGESMGYSGDETLSGAHDLLETFLKMAEPKVKKGGHVAVFWTMRNLDACIDALRSSGFQYQRTLSMYIPKGGARPYLGWLPRTQAIVIGRKYLPKQPSEFHCDMAGYLAAALAKSGLSKNDVAKKLGCDSRLVMKWTRQGDPAWCLPTPRFYRPLKVLLELDDTFDILLDREGAHAGDSRDDFEYRHDTYVVDDKNERMIHPSQKPLDVLTHVLTCIVPKNGLCLDGFSGSGTTLVAAKETGRHFIGIEISPDYCRIARERLNPSNEPPAWPGSEQT